MPGVRDLLERFRPAGGPGAATAHRREAVAAELEPIFAALARTERECDELRDTAASEAEQRGADSAARVRAVLSTARADAPAERARAAARGWAAGTADLDRIEAAGQSTARDEQHLGGEQMQGQVAAVLAAVHADLASLGEGESA
ncbi:hypothetical protein GCM10022251_35480 [Phytohabitans flavus]|uniref:Uncharacterized protein n=1 Tax=Phytohabitans flavus TaxID=1076124 RepID=A0A6F8XMQ4_9ACTN|nr:hypothetical protein [Phytohabitans flavus]BCB75087.1 hypothetical protein Pflav_014970 [Phytohabitans flavus]